MAFTYLDVLSTDRDKVRFRVGDTQQGAGPRPDQRNFSDSEIAFILDEEDDRVNGAIAHCFEILASEWSAYGVIEKEGEVSFNALWVARGYREQASIWRAKPGGADTEERSQSLITLTRSDAWTEAAESEYT